MVDLTKNKQPSAYVYKKKAYFQAFSATDVTDNLDGPILKADFFHPTAMGEALLRIYRYAHLDWHYKRDESRVAHIMKRTRGFRSWGA